MLSLRWVLAVKVIELKKNAFDWQKPEHIENGTVSCLWIRLLLSCDPPFWQNRLLLLIEKIIILRGKDYNPNEESRSLILVYLRVNLKLHVSWCSFWTLWSSGRRKAKQLGCCWYFFPVPIQLFTAEAATPCLCSQASGETLIFSGKLGTEQKTQDRVKPDLNRSNLKGKCRSLGKKRSKTKPLFHPQKWHINSFKFQEREISFVFSYILFNIKQFHYLNERYTFQLHKQFLYFCITKGNTLQRKFSK